MKVLWSLLFLVAISACSQQPATRPAPTAKVTEIDRIPVILDTDIGDDIDDTWALALLLNMPEVDLKMVLTDFGDTRARAAIAAKFLEASARSEIPVGIGTFMGEADLPQSAWAGDYDISRYPGTVYENGVQALIDMVMQSPGEVVIVAIGPVPNIQEALERQPAIADKARIVSMSGSVYVGYDGKPTPDAEYNVAKDPAATRAMYGAKWDVLLAPLDTCGTLRLQGDLYQKILDSTKPEIRALIENYRIWAKRVSHVSVDPDVESSVLFDAQAASMVIEQKWFEIDKVRLEVMNDGFTRRSEEGSQVRAALKWKDKPGFEAWLADRLTH